MMKNRQMRGRVNLYDVYMYTYDICVYAEPESPNAGVCMMNRNRQMRGACLRYMMNRFAIASLRELSAKQHKMRGRV